MFPETFETERLTYRRLCSETIGPLELYDLTSSRSSTAMEEFQYLPWDPAETVKEAADRLDAFEQKWDDRERADWLIVPKEGEEGAGEIVGRAGLICQWEQDLALPAIWLRKPFWGRGYSGERADALLEIAFERLDFGVVAIPLHGENQKSYRAVKKYVQRHGGRYEGLLRNHAARYDGPADHHRFSISREEYEASK
jgi:RimJ/RimL family protein N-acetyltransferase